MAERLREQECLSARLGQGRDRAWVWGWGWVDLGALIQRSSNSLEHRGKTEVALDVRSAMHGHLIGEDNAADETEQEVMLQPCPMYTGCSKYEVCWAPTQVSSDMALP